MEYRLDLSPIKETLNTPEIWRTPKVHQFLRCTFLRLVHFFFLKDIWVLASVVSELFCYCQIILNLLSPLQETFYNENLFLIREDKAIQC